MAMMGSDMLLVSLPLAHGPVVELFYLAVLTLAAVAGCLWLQTRSGALGVNAVLFVFIVQFLLLGGDVLPAAVLAVVLQLLLYVLCRCFRSYRDRRARAQMPPPPSGPFPFPQPPPLPPASPEGKEEGRP